MEQEYQHQLQVHLLQELVVVEVVVKILHQVELVVQVGVEQVLEIIQDQVDQQEQQEQLILVEVVEELLVDQILVEQVALV